MNPNPATISNLLCALCGLVTGGFIVGALATWSIRLGDHRPLSFCAIVFAAVTLICILNA